MWTSKLIIRYFLPDIIWILNRLFFFKSRGWGSRMMGKVEHEDEVKEGGEGRNKHNNKQLQGMFTFGGGGCCSDCGCAFNWKIIEKYLNDLLDITIGNTWRSTKPVTLVISHRTQDSLKTRFLLVYRWTLRGWLRHSRPGYCRSQRGGLRILRRCWVLWSRRCWRFRPPQPETDGRRLVSDVKLIQI